MEELEAAKETSVQGPRPTKPYRTPGATDRFAGVHLANRLGNNSCILFDSWNGIHISSDIGKQHLNRLFNAIGHFVLTTSRFILRHQIHQRFDNDQDNGTRLICDQGDTNCGRRMVVKRKPEQLQLAWTEQEIMLAYATGNRFHAEAMAQAREKADEVKYDAETDSLMLKFRCFQAGRTKKQTDPSMLSFRNTHRRAKRYDTR